MAVVFLEVDEAVPEVDRAAEVRREHSTRWRALLKALVLVLAPLACEMQSPLRS